MKTCFKCNTTKPLDEFYPHKQMADGRLNKCKDCTRADVKRREVRLKMTSLEWYEKELERHRNKAARARALGRRPRSNSARKAQWCRDHRMQKLANNKVSNAIRDGRLKRQPCEFCGHSPAQAHHDDYSRPLDVRWLCVKHHAQVHREMKAKARAEKFARISP